SRDIWGLARNRTPDWKRMAEAGLFRPNLPLIRQIRRDTQDSDMLDLASGELSPELVPHEQFRRLLAADDFPCHFGYEHPQGNPELRDTLVAHMKTWKGIDAAP
ncbi:PLP-dependent aminotransferase family protein, partial [Anoxybacillus sp. LAT_38]|nr:PLP-dependent aminotransferase family protein [Anoxybacillus sp. LAT_38]